MQRISFHVDKDDFIYMVLNPKNRGVTKESKNVILKQTLS